MDVFDIVEQGQKSWIYKKAILRISLRRPWGGGAKEDRMDRMNFKEPETEKSKNVES